MNGQRLVLVVDDSDIVRAQLRNRLAEHGYDAAEAASATTALATARELRPDAVLLALELPDVDGFELLDRLQQDPALSDIPVVALTVHREVEYAARALMSGAHDYLRKPIEEGELVARLKAAIRTKQLHDSLRATADRVSALAATDELTGVFNRVALEAELERQIARASRYERPLSVLMIDIDALAAVNEQYGTDIGDRVVATCARRLRQRARAADVVGRWGGGEFMVIAPDIDHRGADVLAGALTAAVARPMTVDGHGIGVNASVGYVQWAGHGPEDLVSACDAALYAAKTRRGPEAR